MKTYKGQFRVATLAGRTIGFACSIEQAEYIQHQGKTRIIQAWCNQKQRYVTIRY
jgi:hypothetical protein